MIIRVIHKKKEREIGFVFNISTWMRLSDYTQVAPADYGLIPQEKFFVKMFYCACVQWHFENAKYYSDFDEDDVKAWMENLKVAEYNQLFDEFIKSKIGGESLEELIPKAFDADKQEKKKSLGMTLLTMPLG